MNWLSDMDGGWWPFLHLRPQQRERMDNRCLGRMALHYGVLFGLLVYAWDVFVAFMPLSAVWALVCVSISVAFFFVVYKYSFAVFWNRRAKRLGQEGAASAT
jgi:uncharacterized membrane protein